MTVATFARRHRTALLIGLTAFAVLAAIGLARAHRQAGYAAMLRADPETVLTDTGLRATALALGAGVFAAHCAACHGRDARGDQRLGAPDLTDRDHLYGEGRVAEIEQIVRYGIRAADKRGWNLASMPAYAQPRPYSGEPLPSLSPAEVEDVTQYVLAFRHHATDPAAVARGAAQFANHAGCWDCHGHDAAGDPAIGAPNLTDAVWLYGDGSHDAVYRSIAQGRAGFSPGFDRILSAAEIRAVAAYVGARETAR